MTNEYSSAPNELANLALGELIDEQETAALMKLAVGTLRNWRALKKGPRYLKIGTRTVRYRRSDVAEFIVSVGSVKGAA
jgi:predicted DNA-binding transcriptional regulator AlpA